MLTTEDIVTYKTYLIDTILEGIIKNTINFKVYGDGTFDAVFSLFKKIGNKFRQESKYGIVHFILDGTTCSFTIKHQPLNSEEMITICHFSTSILHLFSFKTPILLGKKIRKNVKSIVGISPTMVLLFHLPCFYLKM